MWAYSGVGTGRLLGAFAPAGQMEAFFREITTANAMPPQDPKSIAGSITIQSYSPCGPAMNPSRLTAI